MSIWQLLLSLQWRLMIRRLLCPLLIRVRLLSLLIASSLLIP
jgi:hypothetical protein